jgi:DNA-binding transcriptional LysR family regulator
MTNLASIDLNLLVALDALISEAHVGRAARKIGLSQPAASHALKRLRDLLSDPLLVRVGSRMELTPRAIGFRESLAETLQRVQTLLVADAFEPRTSSRRFSVMMQDHVAHLIIPALVKRVHADAPAVRLDALPWRSPASVKPERLQSIDLLLSCSPNEIAGFQKRDSVHRHGGDCRTQGAPVRVADEESESISQRKARGGCRWRSDRRPGR